MTELSNLQNAYSRIISEKIQSNHFPNITRVLHAIQSENPSFLNKLTLKLQQHIQDENCDGPVLTGFLIVNKKVLLHFLEGKESQIELYLNFLSENLSQSGSTCKILVFNQEFSKRIFPFWGKERVEYRADIELDCEKPEDKCQEQVWNLYKKFLVAGKETEEKLLHKGGFTSEILKEITNYIQITPEETTFFFCEILMDLEEYLEIYYNQEFLDEEENSFPCKFYVSQLLEYFQQPYFEYNGVSLK